MRFSVRCLDVCAGEKKRILRKSAFCEAEVTEKRTLTPAVHGKAQFAQALSPKSHSATHADHRVRFSVRVPTQSAVFREGADSECAFP